MGQVVDEGQAEALRVLLRTLDGDVVGIDVGRVGVDEIEHAVADALTTGASIARVSAALAIASPPLPITVASTSAIGVWKRIAKPQADGPCAAAKSAANESGCSLSGNSPALAVQGDRAGLVALGRAEAHAAQVGMHGLALAGGRGEFDEFQKPSIPIGFSNVVTCMPRLGWALMGGSSGGRPL